MTTTLLAKKKIGSPIKYYGGKSYLAPWIIANMPPHLHYVETHFGSGAVLFGKDPTGVSEVVNDIDGRLTNLFEVLANPKLFERLKQRLKLLPFSEQLWRQRRDLLASGEGSRVERAEAYFVVNRQSRSGQMQDFTPLTRNRTRGGRNAEVNAWLGAIDGLAEIHERLQQVVILNRDALDVIKTQDGPQTLFYCDPPYNFGRVANDVYAYEMTHQQHRKLLSTLVKCRGKVMLSAYCNPLYEALICHGWRRIDRETVKHSGGGKTKAKAVESLYVNF